MGRKKTLPGSKKGGKARPLSKEAGKHASLLRAEKRSRVRRGAQCSPLEGMCDIPQRPRDFGEEGG